MAPVVALPTLRSHPRWSPRWGLHGACSLWARSCGPSRTLSPLPPHPAALSSGGGVRVPLSSSPNLGGRWCVWGGGGRPCRLPYVARMSQARRKHDASTGRGTWLQWGGGVSPLGPPYPRGRVPHQRLLRAHVAPASPRTLQYWSLPPRFLPLARWFALFFVFFFASPPPAARLSPWRVGLSSAPPHVPSPSPRCPRPFPGCVGEKGVGGGGATSLSVLWRKHVASTAQARGAALVPLLVGGGGGGAVWLPSSPFLPCVRTPGAPPVGACTARASYGHGRVVRPAPSLRCLPTLPLCPRGGGGALSAPPYLHPPPLGGRRCVGGGGGGLSSSLRCTHVAGTTQARRRHEARHLSLCRGGGGMPCGSRRRPFYPAFAPPVVPPLGLARRVLSTGTVVWSVPHPLAAASPPCRFVLGGGGALFAPPYLHPPPLGGRGFVGGGGCPCRLPFVYYYTPLPLNLANKQASNKQASNKQATSKQQALLLSVLAIALIAPGSTLL